jgi:hypothetical protein
VLSLFAAYTWCDNAALTCFALFAFGGCCCFSQFNKRSLKEAVSPGDLILALDGLDVSQEDAKFIIQRLKTSSKYDRFVSLSSPRHTGDLDDDDDDQRNIKEFRRLNFYHLAEDDSAAFPFVGKLTASFSGLLG